MKNSGQLRQKTCSLAAIPLLLLSTATLTAQPERRIVPRHDWAIELPELGRMTGLPGDCLFADKIFPIGDVNRDSLQDWIISRLQCSENRTPISYDLLLYLGVRGGLPDVNDRIRIGVEEGTDVVFRGAGDWDGDGNVDVATLITPKEKDPEINPRGYGLSHMVVWWGNGTGSYSVEDTTRLETTTEYWLGPMYFISHDWTRDGIDDLMLIGVAGFRDREVDRSMPSTGLWIGDHGRWGREAGRRAVWEWNDLPPYHHYQIIDQDVDGYEDLVFHLKGGGGGVNGKVSIIYGTPEHILDTANIHTITLDNAWGKYALFSDITGDGVSELLVNTGGQEAIKAYVGFRGQRIEEQYGLGNEPGRPGEEVWWGKPWATIPLPGQLHDGWVSAGWSPIYDLGDAGIDGVGDVWVFSLPDYICYNGGQRFDSIYDSWIRRPSSGSGPIVSLGDIDGSGLNTIALGSDNLVAFYQPSTNVPPTGKYRYMPPGVGTPETGVNDENSNVTTERTLGLQAWPNPSSGVVRFTWASTAGTATILITDQLGQTVTQFETEARAGEAEWDASQTFGGVYFVSSEVDGVRESIEVRVQR